MTTTAEPLSAGFMIISSLFFETLKGTTVSFYKVVMFWLWRCVRRDVRFHTANKGLKITTLFGGLPVTFQDKARIFFLWAGVNTVGKMGLQS